MHPHTPTLFSLILCIFLASSFSVVVNGGNYDESNPFTPKAYLIRYWKNHISNDLPKPWFLLNKASPLNAAQSASFSKLAADGNSLSTHLQRFCSSANLLCFPDLNPSLEKHNGNVNFVSYSLKNFTNYGTDRAGGVDSFKNYTDGYYPVNYFRRYSRDSAGHDEKFSVYGPDGTVVDETFNSYGTGATGGRGKFSTYTPRGNAPSLRFASYSDGATGREQGFTSYSDEINVGDQSFTSYGKNGNGDVNGFTNYGGDSNVPGSTFSSYGKTANGANDTFKTYASNANNPQNTFKTYSTGGNAAVEKFISYRDQSNVGDDSFQSYGKGSNAAEANFVNYGNSSNEGTDRFTGYSDNEKTVFKGYGVNNTFKDYAKSGVLFSNYRNVSSQSTALLKAETRGQKVNKWVEPGKFFREKMLKRGTIMPMPNILDRMPKRSFLPRMIASKLPFATAKIAELKKLFHANEGSSMANMLADTLNECDRAPSRGETKQCVASVEDMIDFSTSVLGRNVVVRTTENTVGSSKEIMIGLVKGINGGKVTQSVSCHQSLYPYLVYYCHSVPKVRVYEADILDPKTKTQINHGVAICHVDTSSWSPTHGAFIALGSGPGKIEVCHWIFENDMTWTVAD